MEEERKLDNLILRIQMKIDNSWNTVRNSRASRKKVSQEEKIVLQQKLALRWKQVNIHIILFSILNVCTSGLIAWMHFYLITDALGLGTLSS